jgi:hypothetical protein
MAKTQITPADLKKFLTQQVRDDVRQFRRELAIQRININKAIGVGNMEDYIREWEQDFQNSSISVKPSEERKNKSLKRVTQTNKKKVKL